MTTVEIGTRSIGPGHPCFIIAEAGINHNGNLDLAHRLIDVAVEARADAVKFQTFIPEKVVSSTAQRAKYQTINVGEAGSQIDMIRHLVIPDTSYPDLIDHAGKRSIIFLSTPFDQESADLLERLEVPAFKVSSGDVTNIPLLRHLSRKGLPILLSTGMSEMAEVAVAVETVRSNGDPPLALLHCVSNYPAAPEDCNLRAMESLRNEFGTPVGWSDHTLGIDISLAAVALGANLVEKHVTVNRSLPGPDHMASLEPHELNDMVRGIRHVESAMGDGTKRRADCELENAKVVRRSLHWRTSLPAGVVVKHDDLIALRPGTGVPTSRIDSIVGRVLRVAVGDHEMVVEEHLEQTGKPSE
jgi:N,N'-diacetyllegionaminate synthase